MARRAGRRVPEEPTTELEIWFPGPDGRPIEVEPLAEGDPLSVPYEAIGSALAQVRARGTPTGFGAADSRSARRGVTGEVVAPVLVAPGAAARAAVEGPLFSPALARLHLAGREPSDDGSPVWRVELSTRVGRRRATLRLGPSPSTNLTVLELVPRRSWRLLDDAFVDAGVPVLAELAARLLSISGATINPPSATSTAMRR